MRGLDSGQAARLYAQAARQTKVGVPPEHLRHSLYREWVAAAAKAGLPELDHPFVGPRRNGVFYNYVTAGKDARREDSYTAYLEPVLRAACKGRVKVVQGATVVKLRVAAKSRKPFRGLCDQPRRKGSCRCKNGVRAENVRYVRGVKYVLDGDKETVLKLRAKREVFVSAGPYGSPKLLQLSGIGTGASLNPVGIKVRVNVPVGRRAQGKALSIALALYRGRPLGVENDPSQINKKTKMQWRRGHGGPLGISQVALTGFFEKSALLEMLQIGTVPQLVGVPHFLSICLQNPLSFGTLGLQGKDPFLPPKVELNYLGKQEEVVQLLACTKKLREVTAQLAPDILATEVMPGNATLDEVYIRATAGNAYHMVGGCAVGSVLEEDLRVKGFDNLRVVDSSSIPVMPPFSGPMSSVYVLAEQAAQLVEEEYGCTKLRG